MFAETKPNFFASNENEINSLLIADAQHEQKRYSRRTSRSRMINDANFNPLLRKLDFQKKQAF